MFWLMAFRLSVSLEEGLTPSTYCLVAACVVLVILPFTVDCTKDGFDVVAMLCGRESVTAPVDEETETWDVVPERDVTPVFEMMMLPGEFAIPIPVDDVSVDSTYPVPSPMRSWPPVGVVERPVPPFDLDNVPESTMPPDVGVLGEKLVELLKERTPVLSNVVPVKSTPLPEV